MLCGQLALSNSKYVSRSRKLKQTITMKWPDCLTELKEATAGKAWSSRSNNAIRTWLPPLSVLCSTGPFLHIVVSCRWKATADLKLELLNMVGWGRGGRKKPILIVPVKDSSFCQNTQKIALHISLALMGACTQPKPITVALQLNSLSSLIPIIISVCKGGPTAVNNNNNSNNKKHALNPLV